MAKRLLFLAYPVLLIAACTTSKTPTAPTSAPSAGAQRSPMQGMARPSRVRQRR